MTPSLIYSELENQAKLGDVVHTNGFDVFTNGRRRVLRLESNSF